MSLATVSVRLPADVDELLSAAVDRGEKRTDVIVRALRHELGLELRPDRGLELEDRIAELEERLGRLEDRADREAL
jgi:hypothetical protein